VGACDMAMVDLPRSKAYFSSADWDRAVLHSHLSRLLEEQIVSYIPV